MFCSIRSNSWFSIPQLAAAWAGGAGWPLGSTWERGAGPGLGHAWDEQFQHRCRVLPSGMGHNLLLLLWHPQQPWQGLDAVLRVSWGLCPCPQSSPDLWA